MALGVATGLSSLMFSAPRENPRIIGFSLWATGVLTIRQVAPQTTATLAVVFMRSR
jgi:hypothetical protein